MRLEKLLLRDDIPEDAKDLIRTEIAERKRYRNNQEKSSESIKLGEERIKDFYSFLFILLKTIQE